MNEAAPASQAESTPASQAEFAPQTTDRLKLIVEKSVERDYRVNPFIVIWEVTRACALKCLHCRAEAQYKADPRQLTLEEGKKLIDDVCEMDRPLFVFTGGDPLMRPDLFDLAKYAIEEKKLPVSMTPSATPRVTKQAIAKAKEVGLSRWAFSLDGSCAEIHDHFRGTKGSYDLTMRGIEYLQELNIPIQINTTVSNYNLEDLAAIADKVKDLGAVLWSLFFLVPTGRGMVKDMISPEQHERVMEWLVGIQQRMPYGVKATEAPHFRRVMLQQRMLAGSEVAGTGTAMGAGLGAKPGGRPDAGIDGVGSASPSPLKRTDLLGRAPKGVNDGDGFMFISHIGDVYPSGFLPVSCGNVRESGLSYIYRESPVFKQLRDKSLLKGKCGVCEFKEICGGSRSRAYALTGDYLESDPYCAYIPKAWDAAQQEGVSQ
jgi:radical SAM protein